MLRELSSIIVVLFLMQGNFSFGQNNSASQNRNSYTSGDFQSPEVDLAATKSAKVIKKENVTIIEMIDQYLFPSSIDESGEQVVIQTFGTNESSYFWTLDGGLVTFPGKGTDVASNGTVVGDFINEDFPGGGTVETTGTWDIVTEEWTFLGINPAYPTASGENYTSGWGQSNDGSTIVGMQWHDGWSVTAFKWTEADGYTMIGEGLEYDSRASGISGNGEVIFGWVSSDMGYWRPIIWKDDAYTLIAGENAEGEVMCASNEGTYVAGKRDNNAFFWSEEGGMVSFGSFDDYPTIYNGGWIHIWVQYRFPTNKPNRVLQGYGWEHDVL